MASFPDNLPLNELDPFYRALIYLGIVYFFATAFSSWLITRKRAKPVRIERIVKEDKKSSKSSAHTEAAISFEDTIDKLASLKVEISGAESSLNLLNNLKNSSEISNEAYVILTSRYNSEVTNLTNQMNEMIKTDIISTSTGEVEKGISDEEMEDIEADLEKQLMELDGEDDFLKPRSRRKTPISKTKKEKDKSKATPVAFTEEPKHEKVKVDSPPPKTKAESPVAPPTKPKTPAPTPMATPMATKVNSATPKAQAPSAPKASTTTAPKPAPPISSTVIPEPKGTPEPQASKPATFTPVSAAQPMKAQSEPEKEQIFAKSTSIAALRMDMLRELARLKKLINEDE